MGSVVMTERDLNRVDVLAHGRPVALYSDQSPASTCPG